MKKKTKETLMPYADTLLSLRTLAGLTQEELAERSGLISNQSTATRLENEE